MNTWTRPSGIPAATQRSQNTETMSVSGVPARPAWVSHADNSVKRFSFMPRLYRNLLCGRALRACPRCCSRSGTRWLNKQRNVRYWHLADMGLVHCTCLLLTQSGHSPLFERCFGPIRCFVLSIGAGAMFTKSPAFHLKEKHWPLARTARRSMSLLALGLLLCLGTGSKAQTPNQNEKLDWRCWSLSSRNGGSAWMGRELGPHVPCHADWSGGGLQI